ncbi:unnamed protein product, partial [Musa acuminata subsp. burmannicoides]
TLCRGLGADTAWFGSEWAGILHDVPRGLRKRPIERVGSRQGVASGGKLCPCTCTQVGSEARPDPSDDQ